MKKGFTLIELLIVMVIISALIAVALPKYNRAMERGRALEGINKVKYAAEYAAAKCMATDGKTLLDSARDVTKGEDTFETTSVSTTPDCVATVTVERNEDSKWFYTLTAVSNEDETTITCSGTDCEALGLVADDLL